MDIFPLSVMLFALTVSVFIVLGRSARPRVCVGSLLVGSSCLSLVLSRVKNRYRSRVIESKATETGEIILTDTLRGTWFLLVYGILASILMGIPWLVSLYMIMPSVLWTVTPMWVAWAASRSLLFPVRYTVTTEGVWTRFLGVHSFVYFKDLECIYRHSGVCLVLPSDKSAPVVRFSDYVVLSLKPERKLPNEKQNKYLTPTNAMEFMSHLPSELIVDR